MFKLDDWNEVVNGEDTYQEIASQIAAGITPIIGWSDGQGTHFDILFVKGGVDCPNPAHLQGGIRPSDLFVSIMRMGAFGFEVNDLEKHPGYIEEKLARGNHLGATAKPLADLINGVILKML